MDVRRVSLGRVRLGLGADEPTQPGISEPRGWHRRATLLVQHTAHSGVHYSISKW